MLYIGLLFGGMVTQFMAPESGGAPGDTPTGPKSVARFDFDEEHIDWKIIDDGVMGGRSQGTWRVDAGLGIFAGTLSLENNGGFSSVRSGPRPGVYANTSAFRLRVKGDGRTYQFRVRTDGNFDGVSYRAHFETKAHTWQEVELPLSDFEASFRGRVLTDYPPLEGDAVVTVGFLLADKNPGDFHLEVDWIEAIGNEDVQP